MVTIKWTGWGILALPPLFFLPFVGGGLSGRYLDDPDHPGLGVVGWPAGLLVGGVLAGAVGLALNRRRAPNGSWVPTDRHELFNVPAETVGGRAALIGFTPIPILASWGFVPTWASWIVLALSIVVALLIAWGLSKRRDRAAQGKPLGSTARAAQATVDPVLDAIARMEKALERGASIQWVAGPLRALEKRLKRIEEVVEQRAWEKLPRAVRQLETAINWSDGPNPRWLPVEPYPQQRVDELLARLRAAYRYPATT